MKCFKEMFQELWLKEFRDCWQGECWNEYSWYSRCYNFALKIHREELHKWGTIAVVQVMGWVQKCCSWESAWLWKGHMWMQLLQVKPRAFFLMHIPYKTLRVWRICIHVLWPCRLSPSVSTSLRKQRHAKPFPDLASTAWPHPPLQPSKPGCPHTDLPTATGRGCARDPSLNPAAQPAPSPGQHRHCYTVPSSTRASTDTATLSNTKFSLKPTGKGN